jgi:hypothetical protein
MKVTNLNGTTQNTCRCGSWLAHWGKFSDQVAHGCFVNGCSKVHSVGGHVQKDSTTDRNWYIVPLCDDHNRKWGESLDIWDGANLVSANVSETCEKRS